MEVSHGLLVAIMFLTILTFGIANILTSLAVTVGRHLENKSHPLQIHWRILLLLVHFNIFWHTLDLLGVEDWEFTGFLMIILGPIFLFFATSILLKTADEDEPPEIQGQALASNRRFFILLAVLQVWVVGADLFFGRGFTTAGSFNVVMFLTVVFLAVTNKIAFHLGGVVLFWLIVLAEVVLVGAGVII